MSERLTALFPRMPNWRGWRAAVLRQVKIKLASTVVEEVVTRHGAQSWFVYGHNRRREDYRNCWWPSLWLARRLPAAAPILETGCGCGLNLLWFAQAGYNHLFGFDLDGKAIAAGQELFARTHLPVQLWVDDGLVPAHLPPAKFEAILGLNWTYLVQDFDLVKFLLTYRPKLDDAGYLVIDLIDSLYNNLPNNQYLTSDWGKPEESRRPTEYKKRYSYEQVRESAAKAGLCIIHREDCWVKNGTAPKCVYILTPSR